MAAFRSGVTPGYLAKCFLRQSRKPRHGSQHFTEILNPGSVQRSHLHTVLEYNRPTTRALLGQRHHGKFVWVKAVAVRHNSSQIPPESRSAASPELDAVNSPVLQSSPGSLPADPAPSISQPITEQIPAEVMSSAATEVDTVPLVLDSSADPAPNITQPIAEQIPVETILAAEVVTDPAPNITQPITEQVPFETILAAVPEVVSDPAPNITQPIAEQNPFETILAALPEDPAPNITQPIIEQVPFETILAAVPEDPASNITQPITEQIPFETILAAVPEVNTNPAPIITQPIAEQIPVETILAAVPEVVTDPAPTVTQPITEQIPFETILAAVPEVNTNPAPNITQPIAEQIPVETVLSAVPEVNTNPAPSVTQPIAEQIPADTVLAGAPVDTATVPLVSNTPVDLASVDPVLTQPIAEQVVNTAPTAADVLQAASSEPTLMELGLGAFTPPGLIQNLLEFVHLELGLPWWGAIVAGTLVARMLMFPVIVKGQREAAKLNNVLPEMTKLNTKMTEAKQSGNKFELAKAYTDLNLFQKKHDVNPLRGFMVSLVQAPVFISFFIALRKMAYLPVPSLQTGGVLWFPDLTLADPYYILPLVVTGTMCLVLELGAESGVDNPNLRTMKTVFRIMPLVILPLTINFPTAIFTYWLTSNCFSLGQVALLRNSEIRKRLRIPDRITHPPLVLPQSEGFLASLKKGWKNAQLAQQLEERERRIKNHLDLAAKGPLRQTFTHNPLQQTQSLSTASAKGKTGDKVRPWKNTIG